mgnify:CR=1 FL=1
MKSLEYLPSLDDVLYHLIPNLAAHWKDELTYPQQKYIYPSDPKDPLEWGPDLAFTIYARWYLREIDEELANFILQSDETEIISPDLIELLEKRREGEEEELEDEGMYFEVFNKIMRILTPTAKELRHRVCDSCLSTDIFEFIDTGEIFCCVKDEESGFWIQGDCGAQPKKQGVLNKEQWQHFVDKGAPEFYLKDIDEIADEAIENNMSCTTMFRIYDAHPYEAVMSEFEQDDDPDESERQKSLRDTCFILYDQVRTKLFSMQIYERYGYLGISEEFLLKILEKTGHHGAIMNAEVIFGLNIEDYMDICDCDLEAATSVFESLEPIRKEHKIETEFSKANRNYELETSMIELRHKMGLISLEDAAELTDQAESKSPWKQRKQEKRALKVAIASDLVAEHTQRAYQWASDLGLRKITGAQLSLFFFEEGGRPDGDVSRKILKQVNEILNS